MLDFLKQLFEDGEVTVPRDVSGDMESVRRLLIFTERIWREDWPGTAPGFDVDAAAKAAAVLLTLCQATAYRELDEYVVSEHLERIGLTTSDSVSTHYSVDLVLRFLPQVFQRLSRTSADDPILPLVLQLAKAWPLSSVGMPDCAPEALPEVFRDSGLLRVYADRVIRVADQQRMSVPEVAAAVQAALCPYENLRSKCGLEHFT